MWAVAGLIVLATGCGRLGFDEIPPTELAYPSPVVFVYNDVDPTKTRDVPGIKPEGFFFFESFTIEPDLTALTGLSFEPTAGKISGKPTTTTPPTDYTVIADGEITGVVNIRTAPGFLVTTDTDDADLSPADDDCVTATDQCSLRAATEQLNLFVSQNRVVVIPPGTIKLGGEQIALSNPTELIGTKRDKTVIDADSRSRVFDLGTDNATTVSDLTVKNGNAVGQGGCIVALGGSVSLLRVSVLSCTSTGNGGGAAVLDDFSNRIVNAVIQECLFDGNVLTGNGGGGGLGLSARPSGSSSRIVATTFTNNSVAFGGTGGGLGYGGGTLLVERSLFSGNTGQGGAIETEDGSDLTLVNNTITGNISVSTASGGIHTNNVSALTLINNTIANNTCMGCFGAAGIGQNSGGSGTIENSIVVDNIDLADGGLANFNALLVSNGHNVTDSSAFDAGFSGPADVFEVEAALEPLADNGGPTKTRAISNTSPAFNVANVLSCPATDQRAFARPANGGCDAGAFELQ